MHIFHKQNKFIRRVEKIIVCLLILSWTFSPLAPIIHVPFLDKDIRLGMEVEHAHATFGNGYEYRRAITVDPTRVTGSSNLTDFPVLVSLSHPNLATVANGGKVTDANGYDIVFASDVDGAVPLDHEIERYVATGEVTMWVRVPTLDTTSNTIIYMFYGNSSVSTSQEDITGTWNSGYQAVLHLEETSGQHQDSTSNNNDSTAVSVTTQGSAVGKIGGADSFNGTSDSVTITDHATLDLANTGTIEAWMSSSNINTWESSPSAWQSIATSTLTGAGAQEYSNVDSVIVGEKIYYGAMMCSGTTETFLTASTSLSAGAFSSWVSGVATGTSANAGGGCAIGVDSDGKEIWYATLSSNGTTARAAYATSTLANPTVAAASQWKMLANVATPSLLENSSIDVVITGARAYFAALAVNGATESFYTGSVGLDGSGWTGWTNQVDPVGAGAGEGCSTSIDTDGVRLYYTALCQSAGTEDYEVTRSNLNGTGFAAWTVGNDPAGTGADDYSFSDASLIGGQMYHASFAHADKVTDFNSASTTVEGGTLTWLVKKTSSATVDPDGAAAGDTTDTLIESDGKNIYYGAFTHASTSASFFISSSTLPAHPFVSKLNAYELMQTGKGYVFDWAGKPSSFSTTTPANTFEHVVITHDGSFMNYYKNGILMASTSVNTDFESNSNDLLLGKGFRSDGSSIFFPGIIDEVRISNTSRSGDWINTQYNNQNSTSTFYSLGEEYPIVDGPSLYSVQNQRFVIGAGTTATVPIVFSGGTPASATIGNDILIAIATTSGFLMEWDISDTSATISGTGSGKVSSTVSYVGPSVLKIDVTSDFTISDSITISDLGFKNFTAPEKTGTGGLRVYTGGTTGGTVVATSTSLFTIGSGKVSKISKPPNYLMTSSGLVGHWTFDGKTMYNNVGDSSGQGNNGNLIVGGSGNTSTTTTGGKIGQALNFDGINDYVDLNNPSSVGLTTFSLSVWFKRKGTGVTASTGTGGLVGATVAEPLVTKLVGEQDGDNRDGNYFFGVIPGTSNLAADFESTLASANNNPIVGSTTVSNDVWNHGVVTFDGSNMQLYLNGVADGGPIPTTQTPRSDSIQELAFGTTINSVGATSGFWNGDIDEVRIYGRALTSAEIGFLYRAGAATIDKSFATGSLSDGLIGWWTMDGKDTHQNFVNRGSTGLPGYLVKPGGTATSTLLTAGKIGQAFKGDGLTGASASYLSVTRDTAFNLTSAFTISVWVRPKGGSNTGIVHKGTLSTGQPDYGIIFDTTNRALCRVSGGGVDTNSTSNAVPYNTWTHIVCTYDGAQKPIYINGQLDTPQATTGAMNDTASSAIYLGVYYSNGFTFNGDIDDVRIYNRALTAAEVNELYTSSRVKVNR